MFRKKQDNIGVSPVIGVILMVAITVIISAVVANFVLDLGQQLDSDADAQVSFDQTVSDFSNEEYEVEVTIGSMENSDYVVVGSQGQGTYEVTYSGDDPTTEADIPDDGDQAGVGGTDAVVLITSGDTVTVEGLDAGDTVQVFGGIDGDENIVTEYDVADTL